MAEGQSTRRRGAGLRASNYTAWEWARGYIALVLVFPLYLGLWLFATLCPQLLKWATALLLRRHIYQTQRRKHDVRIPGDPSIPEYMLRWWRIRRNWAFNCYYHIVKRSDDDTALHDHPWWNFSIVLDGGYYEHLILPGGVHTKTWYGPGAVRFRWHGGFAHRLELPGQLSSNPHDTNYYGLQQARTIFITGPVLRRWGFHHPERWVDAYEWDEFCDERGISVMKMAGYAEQLKGPTT